MSRPVGLAALVGLATLACACAVAGSGSGIDAAQKHDGPRPIDAPARMSDGPASASCTSAATCATAISLGGVSGDTGASAVSASGYQSAWYSVRVTENDSGVFGVPQKLLTRLTSPASEQYDVFVYVNTGSDVIECTTPTGTATTGTTESIDLTWGETGTFSNGNDDSRTVSIEIRPKPGTCAAGQLWQLVATGDS